MAAELAGPGDAVMKTLEEHLDCEVFLRGNVLTLDGDDELAELVTAAIAESGATEQKDMGAVMKAVMPKVGGRADGKRVSAAVKERLTA